MPISPLNEQQLKALHDIVDGLSDRSKAWLSGYLWGISQSGQTPAAAHTPLDTSPQATAPLSITVLSASQTGNARQVGQQLEEALSQAGFNVTHTAVGQYKPKTLAKERYVIVVTSTQGEGEPPEEAFAFFKLLTSKKAPDLSSLHFAVLGLGDSSYAFFCQAGKLIDERFEALGAKRLLPRIDADVDYDEIASAWRTDVVRTLQQHVEAAAPAVSASAAAVGRKTAAWHRDTPFKASVLVNQKITGRGSDRDVRHIELDLSGSGLTYVPGDALGVWYNNAPALVDEWLDVTHLSGDEPVTVHHQALSLREALQSALELTVNSTRFIERYAELSHNDALGELVRQGRPALQAYAATASPIDVLRHYPAHHPADAASLVALLRPLAPRLYSISSAQVDANDEVHITVGVVRYNVDDRERCGGASGYLSRLSEDDTVRVFIEHNDTFRLPDDTDAPVIMVGPGTGIAPFRAFIQQRAAEDANGKHWLFFGNPHFTEDFLYQVEWQHYVRDGVLDRIDLAWSRDQAQKVYVQDKLREQGADVWQWLQDGAYIYVCGDATHMARDVDMALLDIIQRHGSLSYEDADDYLTLLRAERRYQRDVY